jgi:hypothetical protein
MRLCGRAHTGEYQAPGIAGAVRHALSGLLKCGLCVSSYAIADSYTYASAPCSSV